MAKKSSPKRPQKPATPPEAVSERIDQELAAACLRKRQAGQKPTREEIAALRRIEKAREEALRWQYYETVPKKHYLEMAGNGVKPRAAGIILEQADRYGLPLKGKTVNLRDVIRGFHDFIAENKYKLAADDDPLMAVGGDSVWMERYREEQTLIARLKRQAMENELLRRSEVHDGLVRVSLVLRGVGEMLERQFGSDALQLYNDGLDDAQLEIDRIFSNGHSLKGESETEDEAGHEAHRGSPPASGRADREPEARPAKRSKSRRRQPDGDHGES